MSLWSDANKRLSEKGIRTGYRRKFRQGTPRQGMRGNTDRIVTREVETTDGETVRRRAIVPKDRSKYNVDGSKRS